MCQKWWVGCSPPFIWRSFGKIEKYYWGQWGLLRLRAKWSVYWSAHFRQRIWSVCVLRWFTSFICLLKCSVSFMPPHIFDTLFSRSESYACESWAVHNIIVLSSVTMIDDFCSMCESVHQKKIIHNIDMEWNLGNIRIPYKWKWASS